MRRLTGVLLSLFSAAASADTITYLAYEAWGKTWHDADKAFDGQDENLCWAAAASNVLSYNEWSDTGVPAAQSEDEIFQEFKDHWSNVGGRVDIAWYWWMYGGGFSDVDFPGGGGHWPDGRFPIWPAAYAFHSGSVVYEPGGGYYIFHDRLMDFANLYLHMGFGATVSIHHPGEPRQGSGRRVTARTNGHEDALNLSFYVSLQFVLPDTEDLPALAPKLGEVGHVADAVLGDLVAPEGLELVLPSTETPAVPEVPVEEDRYPPVSEDDVRSSGQPPYMSCKVHAALPKGSENAGLD